jgi:type IV pilus assembly protein PilY1
MILKKLILNQLRYSKLSQTVKPLCYAVTLSMVALPVNAGRNDLGDLEIYKAAESGGAVLTLMLDTSGSMGTKDFGGRQSRLTILKNALTELFEKKDASGNYTLSSNNIIGLGQYSVDKTGDNNVDDKAGSILVPARKLDETQRTLLINALKGFKADGFTPAANAYAEAGAYMMGTTTVSATNQTAFKVLGRITKNSSGNFVLEKCVNNAATASTLTSQSTTKTIQILDCKSGRYNQVPAIGLTNSLTGNDEIAKNVLVGVDDFWTENSNTRYYLKKNQKVLNDTDQSGYTTSVEDSKDQNNDYLTYNAPVSDSQCSGYGIYFLTDGEPNRSSNSIASGLMNLSLTGNSSPLSISDKCSGDLPNGSWGSEGAWSCMGDYSKKLRDVTNPSKRSILTATVGFGKEFAGIKTSVDGAGKTVYHCDESASSSYKPSQDAKNLCELGSEAYGGGGFYYTTDADSLAASVTSFTAKLTQVIETAPSGTITIPNDPLSSTNLQPFAYLPMLEPKVAGSQYVWPGNLKKYNVYQGTLYGKSTFPFSESSRLYVDDDGDDFPDDLSTSTQDLWSTIDYKNDKGESANNSIYAGGAYARLKAPTAGANANTTRNVYVESGTGSNTKLVNIKVTNGTVIGFDQLDTDYGVAEKLYLLSFLGYSVSTDAAATIAALNTAAKQTTAFNDIVRTYATISLGERNCSQR